jgi:pimeloyl-ACP methyl ester carboxylesterase
MINKTPLGALFALTLLLGQFVAAQTPTPAQTEDQRLLPYAQPGQLVDIGGRRINLQCEGTKGPTVILLAGIFSWSLVWYKTQHLIAEESRVCAFDRASYGFSDPAPRPQLISDVVEDLHKALKTGSIPGPYLLVAHSLGGLEARVYAQHWPKDVVGMVLIDTSPAGEGLINENIPGYDDIADRESYASATLHCAFLAARGSLDPTTPEFNDCTATLPDDTPAAFREIWPRFFTADYYADKVSLMSSLYTHRYDSADHHRLGSMPLVVLSAEHEWIDTTPTGVRFIEAFSKYWFAQHEALAHLSSRGVHRIIKGSGHQIQLDNPQAVVDAVKDVLAATGPGPGVRQHRLALGPLRQEPRFQKIEKELKYPD